MSLALRTACTWSMSQKVKRGDAARAGVATGPDAVPQVQVLFHGKKGQPSQQTDDGTGTLP